MNVELIFCLRRINSDENMLVDTYDVDDAFEQIEEFYYKALEQKDQYYQETLRQEMENQQLEYRSQLYGRTLLIVMIASFVVIIAIVLVVRYRIRAQHEEKRQIGRAHV